MANFHDFPIKTEKEINTMPDKIYNNHISGFSISVKISIYCGARFSEHNFYGFSAVIEKQSTSMLRIKLHFVIK